LIESDEEMEMQFKLSVNLDALIAGWGTTNLTLKLMSTKLKVLKVKTVDWNVCYKIFSNVQNYHICSAAASMGLNQAVCKVCNHFSP